MANDVISDVAAGSEDESVVSAAERVEGAKRTVDTVLRFGLVAAGVCFALWAVVAVSRATQKGRRLREAEAIQSYQRNLARAESDERQRRRENRREGTV